MLKTGACLGNNNSLLLRLPGVQSSSVTGYREIDTAKEICLRRNGKMKLKTKRNILRFG